MIAAAVGAAPRGFEISGQVEPPGPAAVTLHHVPTPFAASALAGLDGKFRFTGLPPGAYTITAFVPGRAEGRLTVDVGPGSADSRGRVRVRVTMEESREALENGSRVSARQLAIPAKARRDFERALQRLAQHDVPGAIQLLERAVAEAPQFAAAWNQLGTIAYQTRNYPLAERHFRRALEADGEAYEPLVNLGGVLLNLGRAEEARSYNLYAVLKRPRDPLAQSQLGMTYFLLRRWPEAEQHLREAIRLDPAHFSHPQLMLSEILESRGGRAEAAAQLEEFLRLHPDSPLAAQLRERVARLRRN
jgi:tetratricopeptide (TPR) repeat protein